jgi:putative transposase
MVNDPADYLWSSYRAHAFGINARMWTPHAEYLALGATKASRIAAYHALFDCELEEQTSGDNRLAANTGLVLGNDTFRKQVEQLTGQRQHHLKRCPKAKRKPKPDPPKSFYSDPKPQIG